MGSLVWFHGGLAGRAQRRPMCGERERERESEPSLARSRVSRAALALPASGPRARPCERRARAFAHCDADPGSGSRGGVLRRPQGTISLSAMKTGELVFLRTASTLTFCRLLVSF